MLIAAALIAAAVTAGGALAAIGDLSNSSCIKDSAAGECASSAQGLLGATGVAVSPDGKSVYVVSSNDSAIARFDRDANGALSNPTCIKDAAAGECANSAEGLAFADSVAVSPDNKSVYVVGGDNAIVRFDRDVIGALSNPSCIRDVTAGECASSAEGLALPVSVAVSPDNKSVYAVSVNDDAIVRFDRDASGALSNPSCIKDLAAGECASSAQGLDAPNSVAVSPDGKSVYVASKNDDAIVHFDRDTNGALSNPSCIKDLAAGECASSAQGLDGPNSVAVSPDNKSVYVASGIDSAIVRFDREVSVPAPPATIPAPAAATPVSTLNLAAAIKKCKKKFPKGPKRKKCIKRAKRQAGA